MFSGLPRGVHEHFDGGEIAIGVHCTWYAPIGSDSVEGRRRFMKSL